MKHSDLFPQPDLQLFADGGAAGEGSGAGETTGETAAVAVPQEAPTEEADKNDAFERLIRGEYKEAYQKKVQDTIRRRLRANQEDLSRYQRLIPTLELLGKRYGLTPDDQGHYDPCALQEALQTDAKRHEAKERKDAISRQLHEAQSRRQAVQWARQAQALQELYHGFDLRKELKDPQFKRLMQAGVDLRAIYELRHKEELLPAAMAYAAKAVEQRLSNKLAAAGSRPAENGCTARSAAVSQKDVSKFTRQDRLDIIRRVQRGERISFP